MLIIYLVRSQNRFRRKWVRTNLDTFSKNSVVAGAALAAPGHQVAEYI